MKKFMYWLLVVVLSAIILEQVYEKYHICSNSSVEVVDSTTIVDEKPDIAPVIRDSVIVRYEYVRIPTKTLDFPAYEDSSKVDHGSEEIYVAKVSDDSIAVQVPISQKLYETEDYRAYVSGYKATLDSIYVYSKFTTVKIREPIKRKRFSIGLQAGYGITPKGFQPYVGIGATINLFSF